MGEVPLWARRVAHRGSGRLGVKFQGGRKGALNRLSR
jgi:hypothetical protein